MRILLIASYAESFVIFRKSLIEALQKRGLEVHVVAPDMAKNNKIRMQLYSMGLHVHDVPMVRTGTNPLADLSAVWFLWRLIYKIKPDIVLGYTVKPVIYGTLAAWLAGVQKRFALITGLGYVFREDSRLKPLQILVQTLYRIALARTQRVFFQNPDDLELFRKLGILRNNTPVSIVNGSGVDLSVFTLTNLPPKALQGNVQFLFIGRLLVDKGLREYVQAARKVKLTHPEVDFALVGWIDSNPNSIDQDELDGWVSEGSIKFLGRLDDVRPAIASCSVFVLPSYREGTPRTVLEAMAMGRAIITTDAPGCKETVVNGINGFLVPSRNVEALVEAMFRFINEPELQQLMGYQSLKLAKMKYDVNKVNAIMLGDMGLL